MASKPNIKYAFYHADGGGRDSFILASSRNQNVNFNYVPKAPEMPGNKQPGMASSLPAQYMTQEFEPATAQVVGYTGHFPGDRYEIGSTFQHASQHLMQTFREHQKHGLPSQPPHFPDCFPRPSKFVSAEYENSKATQLLRSQKPGFRVPGYAGFSSGHALTSGFTYGAIAAGECPPIPTVVIGEGAPGLGRVSGLSVVQPNLQPDAAPAIDTKYTKPGYSGHVPGRHFSSNFGKNFSKAAQEMLATNGQPPAGGVDEPERPYIADIGGTLAFPAGNVGRPAKCYAHVAGYKGFRPQATPFELIPGA